VEAGARQFASVPASAVAPAFVAADVGGTHARIGLVARSATAPTIERFEKYVCADYPSLAAILAEFLASLDGRNIHDVAIACAGYCLDGTIINTNLPWTVSLEHMRRELGLSGIHFVNDFEAVAYATPHLQAHDMTVLTAGRGEPLLAPTVVVGPGTGLGAAVRIPAAGGDVVLATEAGQAAFAPSSDRELDVLRILRRKTTHVSIEQVLSGPGLVRLYAVLCELNGAGESWTTPAEISRAASAGADAVAREALHVFCGLMGSVLGDLVLLYGAQGGAFLAGGILPQIRSYLVGSSFVERFLDKGAMRPVLERVPVRLIDHAQLGVLGAASWFISQGSRP